MTFLTLGLVSLALALLYSKLKNYILERRFRQFARAHGAELAPHTPPSWIPWGLTGLYRVMTAEKKGLDIFDDIVAAAYKTTNGGCTTFEGTGLFGAQILNTIDPRNIQAILATNFRDWGVGQRRYGQFGVPLLGRGIFTTDGEEWAYHRGLIRPQFSRDQINDLESVEQACEDLISVLPQPLNTADGKTEVVDLMPLFYRFTLDTATSFLFGESVNSQLAFARKDRSEELRGEVRVNAATSLAMRIDDGDTDMSFSDAFSVSQDWLGYRIRMGALYWLVDGFRYRRAAAKVKRFADHYVKLALEECGRRKSSMQWVGDGSEKLDAGPKVVKSRTVDSPGRKFSLMDALTDETQDPEVLRDQTLVLMLAARDTTATLLSWLFLLLAQHPDVFRKLRSAVLDTFGAGGSEGGDSIHSKSTTLDFADLKSCRYLQYCLNETLRIYPITPVNNRIAVRDTVVPRGGGLDGTKPVAVRKGQLCNFIIYTMHRSTELWGEDANAFKPERWEGRKSTWEYLPFSGGPRICLGQQYALTEVGYLTVRLLQRFDGIEWAGPEGNPRKAFGIVMYPRDGCKVRLRRTV